MSTVTLSIGPKSYAVVCADGQEAHIKALGAMIAEKYAQLGSARAPLEAQNLLFSALFLADELADLRKRAGAAPAPSGSSELDALRETVAALERELADARDAAAAAASNVPTDDAAAEALAERLEALAAQAEASAAALEAGAGNA